MPRMKVGALLIYHSEWGYMLMMAAMKQSPDVNREWIRELLYVWARHVRGPVVFIGWPPASIIGRMMREGPAAGSPQARVKRPFPLEVQRCERAVLKLPDDLRDVVIAKFVLQGLNDKQRARAMRMTVYRFRQKLAGAYPRISDNLT